MAVDREKRNRIVQDLVRVARGEESITEVEQLRELLYPGPYFEVSDKLARSALDWIIRHSQHDGTQRLIQVTPREWRKLRRWVAILHTDTDWNGVRNIPDDSGGCIGGVLTMLCFGGSIVVLYEFAIHAWMIPFLLWLVIGWIAGIWGFVRSSSEDETEFKATSPFDTAEQRDDAMHFADQFQIPEYDQRIHGRGVTSQRTRMIEALPFIVPCIVAFGVVWPAGVPEFLISRLNRRRRASAAIC